MRLPQAKAKVFGRMLAVEDILKAAGLDYYVDSIGVSGFAVVVRTNAPAQLGEFMKRIYQSSPLIAEVEMNQDVLGWGICVTVANLAGEESIIPGDSAEGTP